MNEQKQLVKSLWDYTPGDTNELAFKKGDVITLVSQSNDDWWEGELNGTIGFFPANRVALISSIKPPEVAPRPKSIALDRPKSMLNIDPTLIGVALPRGRSGSSTTPSPMDNGGGRNRGLSFNIGSGETMNPPPSAMSNIAFAAANKALTRTRGESTSTFASDYALSEDDDEDIENGDGTFSGPNPADIKKDGFLSKRNGEAKITLRAWKNTWVELANNHMYFFKDSQSKKKPEKRDKPVYVVDLKSCKIDATGTVDKKKTTFALITSKDDVIMLQSSSDSDMQAWITAILEVPGTRRAPLTDDATLAASGKKMISVDSKKSPKKITSAKPKKLAKADPDENLPEEERRQKAKEKLFAFMKARPTMDSLEQRGLIPQDLTFGGNLALQLAKENRQIPLIVEQCVKRVEEKGMDCVGIYRLSGNASTIQKLRLLYNEDAKLVNLEDEEWNDINVVTGTLKLYFRELKAPLLTFEKYDLFINAAKISDFVQREAKFKEIAQSLPKPNLDTFKYLIKHLEKVREHRDIHKMDAANLAIVFGPTLLRPAVEDMNTIINMGFQNSVIESFILSAATIFN